MRCAKQKSRTLLILVLLAPCIALGQVKLGDDIGLSANGIVSGGYSGSYGSDTQSGHGFTAGGVANINGYYYNPNFLSFNISPYYNESRANSSFQSITDATGVQASTNIFAGSHFPGSVSYLKSFNKQGTFALPGQGDLVTRSNSQAISLSWSEIVPDLPSLTAGFTKGDSSYSVFGANDRGGSNYRSFFLHSGYNLAGFNLGGGYSQSTSHSTIPEILSGAPSEESTSDTKNLNFSASHLLPYRGSAALSLNRSYLDNDYLGYKFNGTIDTVNMSAGITPTPKWNISTTAGYSDNLNGQLYQSTIPPGSGSDGSGSSTGSASGLPNTSLSSSTHAWDIQVGTSYAFAPNFLLNGEYVRREQFFGTGHFSSDLISAGVSYSRPFMGGFMSLTGLVSENRIDNSGANYVSFTTNGNFSRNVNKWRVSVAGSYTQNMQSALINYTTSNYSLNGNTGRRFGSFYWTASAGISRSLLTAQPHTQNSSQSYSTGVGYKDLSVQGNYTHSDGIGLITGAGLTPGPLPPVIPPALLILYGGTSYGATLSGSPVKRLTFSALWSRSKSNTLSQGILSLNHLEQEGVYFQYQFRKVGVSGGYTRLVQGFSVSGLPADFSSYSISLYRWFNFF